MRYPRISAAVVASVLALAVFASAAPASGAPGDSTRAASPRSAIVVPGIVYESTPSVDIKLDVYMPSEPGLYRAAVLIHGRSWKDGSRTEEGTMANRFVDAGFVAFAVDFRMPCDADNILPGVDPNLCHYPYPAPSDDIGAAIEWIRQNGGQYEARTDKIAAWGGSTGGNLAMEVGTVGTAGGTRADVVASWSGMGDLTQKYYRKDHAVVNYLGCRYSACTDAWAGASPALQIASDGAPLYLMGSQEDGIDPEMDQKDTIDHWSAAGVPSEWHLFPGSCHAIFCFWAHPEVLDETVSWFQQWMS